MQDTYDMKMNWAWFLQKEAQKSMEKGLITGICITMVPSMKRLQSTVTKSTSSEDSLLGFSSYGLGSLKFSSLVISSVIMTW